nr:MAG TPA: hypothetical protein [Crassvirales sp.]
MYGDTSFNIKNFNINITINITIIIILIMTTYSHRQYNNRKYNI